MGKGLPRSLANAPQSASNVRKQSIPFRSLAMAVADGAPGWGTVKLAGLPEGNVLYLGAVAYVQATTASASVIAAFTGSYSIGTTATADNLLTGTDADICPVATLSAATAKVSPVTRSASTDALGGGIFDNTDRTLSLNLNMLIDDASISGAAAFTLEGVIHISYILLGDD